MDRQRLAAWLQDGGRTWRWNDPSEKTRYGAVEVTAKGLRWYRWSHAFQPSGVHGEHDVVHQSIEEFLHGGPPREVPDAIRRELEAWATSNVNPPPSGRG